MRQWGGAWGRVQLCVCCAMQIVVQGCNSLAHREKVDENIRRHGRGPDGRVARSCEAACTGVAEPQIGGDAYISLCPHIALVR